MANILKQSTQVIVRMGPFVDVGDGFTPETGITLGAADQAEALKAGGGASVDISAATWAAVTGADGWYDLTLTTGHTDTVGELVVAVQDASVCLPVFKEFQVVEEAIYDAVWGASATAFDANGRVDVGEWLGTAVTTSSTSAKPEVDVYSLSDDATAANNAELDYDGTGYNKSASTIGTCTTNSDMRGTDNAFLAATWTSVMSGITSLKEWLGLLAGKQSGNATARTELRGTGAGSGTYDETTDSLEALRDTEPHGTAMRGTDSALLAASAPTNFGDLSITVTTGRVDLASIEGSDATDQINAACDAALTDYDAPTATEMTAAFTEIKGATWSSGSDTLEHIRDKETDIETDTADIQTQIGTAGAGLTDLGGMSTGMKAEVNTEADTALTDYDPPTKTEMDAAFTEIKGATWSSGTDTLELIRDKETDIETDTQDLQTQVGTAGAGLTAVPWNSSWDAEVQSECEDALAAHIVDATGATVSLDQALYELRAIMAGNYTETGSGPFVFAFKAKDGSTTVRTWSVAANGTSRTVT